MRTRRWQTLLVAGTITGTVFSATVASAAPPAPNPTVGIPARLSNPVMKATAENSLLAILVKLDLTDNQLEKGLALTQKVINEQKAAEEKLLGLLADERKALLNNDKARIEKLREDIASARKEAAKSISRFKEDALDLLTSEQRKMLTQILPQAGKQDVRIGERTRIEDRTQIKKGAPGIHFRITPDLRSGSGAMLWKSHDALPSLPLRMGQLPRWHPDQELPAQRERITQHITLGFGVTMSNIDMLTKLENILKEIQAARQGASPAQAEQLAGTAQSGRI